MELGLLVDQPCGQHGCDHLVDDLVPQFAVADVGGVLRRDDHRVDSLGLAVFVFDRDLALAVRTQPGQLASAAHLFELDRQLVGQLNRHRHQGGRLPAGIAEHQALIAGALLLVQARSLRDALGDVGALLSDGHHDGAVFVVEAHLGIVVADHLDRIADNLRDVHGGLRGDLPGHHNQIRLHQRLAGDATLRILGQHGVEDRVRDAVGDLVRVAHRHRFAGEQIVLHVAVRITHIQSFCHILSTSSSAAC